MYCKKCGAQNKDDSKFCEKCGSELASASQMEMASGSLGLEEGLTKALRTFGTDLLLDPMRFKASVADECDHGAREYIVFERNCNSDLLGPYAAATSANDGAELGRAATLAVLYLNEQRAEDAQTAKTVAACIAHAVGTTCGMGPIDLPPEIASPSVAAAASQVAAAAVTSQAAPAQPAQASTPAPSDQPASPQQTTVQPPVQTSYDSGQQGGPAGQKSKTPIIIGVIAAIATIAIVAFVVYQQTSGPKREGSTSSSVASGQGAVSISFDSGGADGGSMSPLSCASGDSVAIPKCGYTYKGYSFDKWRAPDGTTYVPGDSIVVSENMTLTALWSAEECTVKFLGAGAEGGSTDSIATTSGASIVLPECGFYRTGYDFDCWEDEDGNSYNPGAMVSVSGDASFAAQWKAKKSNSSSSSSSSSRSSTSSGKITTSSFPRSWQGSYEGYTTHTSEGVITRSVRFNFSVVSSDGRLQGIVYVGESEMIEGATHGSYNCEGTLDFNTGAIHIYGTTWVDKGGLIGVGGFKGTVDPDNWTMSGEWYDPEGEAENGAWYMRAS